MSGSYDRIVENLRTLRLPFRVNIRHNVHEGNKEQIQPLRDLVKALSEESGNKITYYPSPVEKNSAADERGGQVGTLCGAHHLYGTGIDDQGRLYKCWEDVDKPKRSFGSAHDWDPADPIATADHPDHLTKYLNTALPTDDPECRDCILLPQCAGGCPTRRLYYQKSCFGFRNAPEKIVLALYDRLQKENKRKAEKKQEKT